MGGGPRAENRMGRWGAVSYIVGNIVGSGIFIVPGTILHHTHSLGLSLLVWLISAAIATLGAYCYVELGTGIRRSGGDFAYLCHVKWFIHSTFNPLPIFSHCPISRYPIAFAFMSCGCILTFPLTLAIQAETFSEYLLQGLHLDLSCSPFWAQLFARKFIGYGLCWLLLFLNFFSLRSAAAPFQMACSIAKILSIALIIFTGLYLLIFQGNSSQIHHPILFI
jgi:amino acid transporter